MTVFCARWQVIIYWCVFLWVGVRLHPTGSCALVSWGSQLVGGACSPQSGAVLLFLGGFATDALSPGWGILAGACCGVCLQGLSFRLRNGHMVRPSLPGTSPIRQPESRPGGAYLYLWSPFAGRGGVLPLFTGPVVVVGEGYPGMNTIMRGWAGADILPAQEVPAVWFSQPYHRWLLAFMITF